MRRLYSKIYFGFLIVMLLAVVGAGTIMHASHGRPHPPHVFEICLVVLGFLAAALAAGSYPIARRITRRLEQVSASVERWGAGDLSVRAPVEGDDEVAQLARNFNIAAARVESLVDQQRRMLASASHELRSPLARLRMALELVGDSELLDDDRRTKLHEEARVDIAELDALVGELLAAARASSDRQLDLESTDIVELTADVCAREGVVALSRPDVDRTTDVDRKLVRRALRNLVDNARRYGEGEVAIRVEHRGDVTVVAVDDDGDALEAAVAERLFEPFFRPAGHDEGRDGGVGLGLSLVRQIAEAHGGRAGYTGGDDGQGSSFWIELPLRIRAT